MQRARGIWTEEAVLNHLANHYNPRLQADKLAKQRTRKRIIPRLVTECRNPSHFKSVWGSAEVIKSYHKLPWCPFCWHDNYLVEVGYERTN